MRKNQRMEVMVREWHARMVEMEEQLGAFEAVTGSSPEAPLQASILALAGMSIKAMNCAFSGVDVWLDWWWLECGLGSTPMEAGMPLRKVATLDDFVQLLHDESHREFQERERAPK